MSYNLPPGVTNSMLPGNRPEDVFWESVVESLSEDLQDRIDNDIDFSSLVDEVAYEVYMQGGDTKEAVKLILERINE